MSTSKKKSRDRHHHAYGGAILCGPLPRSVDTIKVHRLARDGHAGPEEFRNAIRLDRKLILKGQEGFAFVSGGQSDWLDILRPLAWTFHGFQKRNSAGEDSIGPVTRWFRTNTFYRKPLVDGRISSKGDELDSWLPKLNTKKGRGVVFLLGPYSFTKLVETSCQDYRMDDGKKLALDYAQAIAKNASSMRDERGYGCIMLLEPAVGFDISRKTFSKPGWLCQALSKIKNAMGKKGKLGVQFPLADAKSVIPLVERSAADFIGIDGIYTDFNDIKTGKDVLLGVVDGARATIETNEYLARQVSLFLENAEFSGTYYLGSSDRLSDVPFEVAMKKIRALAEFKPRLAEEEA